MRHLENGIAKVFKSSDDEYSVYYRCKPGYMLIGKPVQGCSPSGEWDGQVPECKLQSKIVLHKIKVNAMGGNN